MKIEDFESVVDVDNDEDIEAALAKRYGADANEFWLTNENKKFPALAIMAKNALASLHYFPEEDHPGFISVGTNATSGFSIFFINGAEEQEVPNDSIVPFSTALKVSKEFLISSDLPKSVDWMEL